MGAGLVSEGAHRPLLERVRVLANERVAAGVGLLILDAPKVARLVAPGQFVHLHISRGADFILRRPFSVHRAADDSLQILFQVLGRGTLELAEKKPGELMDLIGPLGTGWRIPDGAAHALVVAGGLGVAPMGMLVERLAERGVATTVAAGAPSAERLVVRGFFETFARRTLLATDDGTAGEAGFVTEVSDRLLRSERFDVAYVCGPEPMARIVSAQTATAGVPCQVSLERLMACGIGACLSCVVTTTSGLLRACCDGPVFEAGEVVWDAGEVPPKH